MLIHVKNNGLIVCVFKFVNQTDKVLISMTYIYIEAVAKHQTHFKIN